MGRVVLEATVEWVNTRNQVTHMLKNGKKLMKKEKVSGGMMNMANTCYRIPEEGFQKGLLSLAMSYLYVVVLVRGRTVTALVEPMFSGNFLKTRISLSVQLLSWVLGTIPLI